jgi:hypothetical protein
LYYFNSSNTYSSTNADTDWASCGHTTSSFTGFGTVSAIETQCKRQGGDLLMKGKFTSGIPTGTEARLSLPLWNGTQLVSAGSSVIPSLQVSGSMATSYFATNYFSYISLIEPSVSYMTMGVQVSTVAALTKASGAGIAITGTVVSFNSRIPIEGWQQSNIIIGQFNGLESCTNTLECTDTFSASVTSTGTVVAGSENVDWLDGNCTFGTGYTCNFKTGIFTATPNCSVTPSDTSGGFGLLNSSSATFVNPIFISRTDGGPANLQAPFRLICQKQGVDYIGKTAKAVASDQNVRTPGLTNSVVYSAIVNTSSDAITGENGDFLSGTTCTNATTGRATCTFNSNVFGSIPICSVSTGGTVLSNIFCNGGATSSTTLEIYCQNAFSNTPTNQTATIVCHGVSP